MSDVRASQQVGSLVALPVMLLLIGSFSGLITFGVGSITSSGIMHAADAGIYPLLKKSFQRENIPVKWK